MGRVVPLPFHAAAPLDSPYISSYTYTLEALLNARARPSSNPEIIHISAVGLSQYPGRPSLSLPAMRTELDALDDIVGRNPVIEMKRIEDDDARVATVLAAMKSSHLVHLACHGLQDHAQPLNSHLVLSDGDLGLRTILNEELKSAEFAFLSACQTATGDDMFANEPIHLVNGFTAAGFRGVIGTLWSIADEDAPRVAKEVYDAIITDEGLDVTKAAEGLHKAVRKMRQQDFPPHRWMPFIHVGI